MRRRIETSHECPKQLIMSKNGTGSCNAILVDIEGPEVQFMVPARAEQHSLAERLILTTLHGFVLQTGPFLILARISL